MKVGPGILPWRGRGLKLGAMVNPISRRRFLRRSLVGAALLAVAGTVGRHLSGYTIDERLRLRVLSPKQYLVLAAACRRLLAADEPGAVSVDEVETALSIDRYLAELPRELQRELAGLLELLEHTPFLFQLRPSRFSRLDAAAQDRVLEDWESSRLPFRRGCFQALKSLAMVGYYGDPRAYAVLDYTGPMIQR